MQRVTCTFYPNYLVFGAALWFVSTSKCNKGLVLILLLLILVLTKLLVLYSAKSMKVILLSSGNVGVMQIISISKVKFTK